jgi:hypothetical protein
MPRLRSPRRRSPRRRSPRRRSPRRRSPRRRSPRRRSPRRRSPRRKSSRMNPDAQGWMPNFQYTPLTFGLQNLPTEIRTNISTLVAPTTSNLSGYAPKWMPNFQYTPLTFGLQNLPRELRSNIYDLVAPRFNNVITQLKTINLTLIKLIKLLPEERRPYTLVIMEICHSEQLLDLPIGFPSFQIRVYSPKYVDLPEADNGRLLQRWWPANIYIEENHPNKDVIFFIPNTRRPPPEPPMTIIDRARERILDILDNNPAQRNTFINFMTHYVENNLQYGKYSPELNSYVLSI